MAQVLVTGGCGNLGRTCAGLFSEAGHEVVLLDQVRPEQARTAWTTDLPVHLVDLTDGPAIEELLLALRPEIVLHLGAERLPSDHPDPGMACTPRFAPPGPPLTAGGVHGPGARADADADAGAGAASGLTRRDATFRSNVLGTYYLLDSAVRAGVRRVVAASSLCVLGAAFPISPHRFEPDYLPVDEHHPLRPQDSYSLSKLANEEMYQAYARGYGLEVVALRPPVVFFEDVPWTWAGRYHDEYPPPTSPARGLEPNLWMYVDGRDLARAFLLAAESPDLTGFEPFYVATDRTTATSPRRWIARHLPHLAPLVEALGDDDHLVSFAKATKLLGYEPAHVWTREKFAGGTAEREQEPQRQPERDGERVGEPQRQGTP